MACAEPSERVIVPSLPITPVPAVAGPLTGGQKVAQVPLHFDVVEVSGANQYSVNPLALVRTVAPPIFIVLIALPLDTGAVVRVALPEPPEPAGGVEFPELPHPAAISAAATSPAGTNNLLYIASLRFTSGHTHTSIT